VSSLRILLLTDRDWTTPADDEDRDVVRDQAGEWGAAGHEVTVLARHRRGVPRTEEPSKNLQIRRAGGRFSVYARAALRSWRKAGKETDVVLEVVDRVLFLTPLWWWLDAPQVTLVRHVHGDEADHNGLRARIGAIAQRTLIRLFYGHHAFVVLSEESAKELEGLGVPTTAIHRASVGPSKSSALLPVLEATADAERSRLRDALRQSQTGAAAGLAVATLTNNAIQLIFTIIFTHLLGASGYGALAALISVFLIMMVAGQSVQVAAAREATLGTLGNHAEQRLTLRRWVRTLAIATVVLVIASALLREPLSHLFGVAEHPWAAAAVFPTGSLWLLLSLQRGMLQGLRAYASVGYSLVGEALGRVVVGLVLVGLGTGVTGAFLGTPLAFALTSFFLYFTLNKHLGAPLEIKRRTMPLRNLVRDNRLPIFGLLLLALLQNMDVILARHEFDGTPAGSYAAAAVAAKAVVWVAIGVGLQVLPEAAKRAADGDDPRPVLLRALAVLAVVAIPAVAIFALVPKLLLGVVFGKETEIASGALPVLGLAMTLLAIAYLTVQYLVALGEMRFIPILVVLALIEPFLLLKGNFDLTNYAVAVLGIQAVAASLIFLLGIKTKERHSGAPEPAPA
jgi:O-antigen/teichoic acid export membrane protein